MRYHNRASHVRLACLVLSTATCGLVGSLLIAGCGGGSDSGGGVDISSLPSAVAQAYRSSTPVIPNIVKADNGFGFQIFNALRKSDANSNVFISPTSLALALQIAYNGANGATQTEMAQALQLQGLTVSNVNDANAALQASLVSPDPQVQLTVANSLWTRDNLVQPVFINVNTTYYGSELGDVKGTPDNVNAWVKAKTNGKITDLLPADDYSQTVAIIANAIYFKGAWTSKFKPEQTQDAQFARGDGSKVTAKLMHQSEKFGYYKGDTFQMARLPYGTKRMSMIVVLPDAGNTLDAVLDKLTPENWDTWIAGLNDREVNVYLPRFKSSYGASLNDTLKALGMKLAFDPDHADLSKLVDLSKIGGNAYISFVYHKTFVEVNEEGTEAAAATGVGVGATSVPVIPQMRMDRPFFYAIRDDKTGTILFLGRMNDPSAS